VTREAQFRFARDSPLEEDGIEPSVPEKARLKGSGRLKVLPGLGYARGPLERQPLAFLAALRIRSSALIDPHLSRRRSRAFRPKAPVHAGRRRCRHSTTSVEAELWITDQPLHSKTCTATRLARSHVPSGTPDKAGRVWMTINSRTAQVAQNDTRTIGSNLAISSSFNAPPPRRGQARRVELSRGKRYRNTGENQQPAASQGTTSPIRAGKRSCREWRGRCRYSRTCRVRAPPSRRSATRSWRRDTARSRG